MKKRNLVYLLTFLFTMTLVAPVAVAAPEHPDLLATELEGVVPVDAAAGAEFTLEATLKGDEGPDSSTKVAISGEVVEFTFDGTTKTDTTGTDGVASVTFTAPATEDTYDYTVFADEFVKDDNNYDYTTEESTVTVTGAEVRTVDSSKNDRSGCRVKGRYSLTEFGQSPHSGPKRKSCVLIHTPDRPRRCL